MIFLKNTDENDREGENDWHVAYNLGNRRKNRDAIQERLKKLYVCSTISFISSANSILGGVNCMVYITLC